MREPFVGRTWLFERVADWLAGRSRMLVITGAPGTGKSAVSARLVALAEEGWPDGTGSWLGAFHVCRSSVAETRDGRRFSESLSGQLADRVSGFADRRDRAVGAVTQTTIHLSGTAVAGVVAPGAVNLGASVTLPALSALEQADCLVHRPLGTLAPDPTPVVLVDALDESLGYAADVGLVEVAASLWSDDTPIRWLVIARPDPRILQLLPPWAERIDLLSDRVSAVEDVGAYVRAQLEPTVESAVVAKQIAKAAHGNFLYARYVVDDLLRDPGRLASIRSNQSLAGMPADLADIYRGFLDRELHRTATTSAAERWRNVYRPLLGLLAVSFEPGLTAGQLRSLVPGEPTAEEICDALESCAQLLEVAEAPRDPWRIYHSSFREFLCESVIAPGPTHRRLADAFVEEWGDAWDEADDYPLGNVASHLVAALTEGDLNRREREETVQQLWATLVDPAFLESHIIRFGIRHILDLVRESTRVVRTLDRDVSAQLEMLEALLMTGASDVDQWASFGDRTLIAQQLHNTAVVLQRPELVDAFAARLDRLGEPHARLRWRNGSGHQPRAVLTGHTAPVVSLAALADGRVASGSWDRTVRIWDTSMKTEPVVLSGHDSPVVALAVLPDGRLASGSWDGTVRIWELSDMGEPLVLRGHTGLLTDLVVLSDGRVASGSWDGTVRVWDTTNLVDPVVLIHAAPVVAVEALLNGRVASASWDGVVRVWDPADPLEPVMSVGHGGDVSAIVAMTGDRLASASHDHTIRVWHLSNTAEMMVLPEQTGPVVALVELPGNRLASASGGDIRIWDLSGSSEPVVLRSASCDVVALAPLPDGRLVGALGDGTVRVWDAADGSAPAVLAGHTASVSALMVLPAGRLVSASLDKTLRLWDVAKSADPIGPAVHTGDVVALVSLRADRLASASSDRTVRVWDPEGRGEAVFSHTSAFVALVALSNGRLAAACADGAVLALDPAGRLAPRVIGEGHSTVALAALGDGRLAVASADGVVRVLDPAGRLGPTMFRDNGNLIVVMAPLSDGRLVTGSDDGTVRVWDPSGDSDPVRLHLHRGWVASVTELADGSVASASDDGTVAVHDLTGERLALMLTGHTGVVADLLPLLDGRLVGASEEGVVWLWDPSQAGAPLVSSDRTITGASLISLPDGRLAGASVDGTLRVSDPAGARPSLTIPHLDISCLASTGIGQLAVGHRSGQISRYRLIEEDLK
jgi:WD40 repeat protein